MTGSELISHKSEYGTFFGVTNPLSLDIVIVLSDWSNGPARIKVLIFLFISFNLLEMNNALAYLEVIKTWCKKLEDKSGDFYFGNIKSVEVLDKYTLPTGEVSTRIVMRYIRKPEEGEEGS